MHRKGRRTSTNSLELYEHYSQLQRIEDALRQWNGGIEAIRDNIMRVANTPGGQEPEIAVLLNTLDRYFLDLGELLVPIPKHAQEIYYPLAVGHARHI
ncbi:hypothetical protein [Intestinirhabdus alba]|jgi:hypothetical protein|uniref:Uncharacterized protein n=1 Tax=Intestinirhabdus alba TaxID=2899544 RepID=A0A6L6IH89_9ENTR|nr:hypothetical protein [Intestinirhabdus alba]MTH44956.1 hypothetical protein [Intestinirhabdus alba]